MSYAKDMFISKQRGEDVRPVEGIHLRVIRCGLMPPEKSAKLELQRQNTIET